LRVLHKLKPLGGRGQGGPLPKEIRRPWRPMGPVVLTVDPVRIRWIFELPLA